MALQRAVRKGKGGTLLVIDANIAFSAGKQHSIDPSSRRCRSFLELVLTICHRAALSDELAAEWDNHQSPFFMTWRIQMKNLGKIVDIASKPDHQGLRDKILATASTAKKQTEMQKDIHLVEAALESDRIIASLEQNSRALFHQAADTVPELRQVMWINPVELKGELESWLKKGLSPKPGLKLGFKSTKKKRG